jgi:hypothetical protein
MQALEDAIRADYERNLIDQIRPLQVHYNAAVNNLRSLISEDIENQQVMSEQSRGGGPPQRPKVKIMEIVDLLKKGYTRYRKDNKGFGSIQEKYGLSVSQIKELFAHEGLKGLKTRTPGIEIIDDRPTTSTTTTTTTTTNNLFD